jgi:mRNA-degrading endonuclease RelE of RelBE toxin-antitoxin system
MALLIQAKAVKELKNVPREDWESLEKRLEDIAQDPRGAHPAVRPLRGQSGHFRVRHGDWRAIYSITSAGDIEVVRVMHRREVYR